jgi:hypothetical protein
LANKSLSDLRAASLQLSNYQDSGFIETDELDARINEAVSAYYDLVLGSRETYFQSTQDFSLAGGIGGNTVALPSDLYKVQGLDWNPDTSSVQTVPTLPSFRERNSIGRRSYDWTPGTLTVYPPNSANGSYRLYYTPTAPVLAEPVEVTVSYNTVTLDPTGGSADGTLRNFFIPTASFDSTYLSGLLNISGSADNDGHRLISSVEDSTDVRTSASSPAVVSESFGPGVAASVYLVPDGSGTLDQVTIGGSTTWVFHDVDTSLMAAGTLVTIAGSVSSDGTYTVATIVNDHAFTTTETVPDFETFLPGVTVTFQPAGTVYRLTDTLQPGALWIELFTAASILDKAEQDSGPLQGRLAQQTKRIQDSMRWKQDEPRQVPLVRRYRDGWGLGWW